MQSPSILIVPEAVSAVNEPQAVGAPRLDSPSSEGSDGLLKMPQSYSAELQSFFCMKTNPAVGGSVSQQIDLGYCPPKTTQELPSTTSTDVAQQQLLHSLDAYEHRAPSVAVPKATVFTTTTQIPTQIISRPPGLGASFFHHRKPCDLQPSASSGLESINSDDDGTQTSGEGTQALSSVGTPTGQIRTNTNINAKLDSHNMADGQDVQFVEPIRYKTLICRTLATQGFCPHGDSCGFAHSIRELRTPADNASAIHSLSVLAQQMKVKVGPQTLRNKGMLSTLQRQNARLHAMANSGNTNAAKTNNGVAFGNGGAPMMMNLTVAR